jgi:hypothetical protein
VPNEPNEPDEPNGPDEEEEEEVGVSCAITARAELIFNTAGPYEANRGFIVRDDGVYKGQVISSSGEGTGGRLRTIHYEWLEGFSLGYSGVSEIHRVILLNDEEDEMPDDFDLVDLKEDVWKERFEFE